jgi:hypothetical protein
MDAISIVNGNECGRSRECWHERFNIYSVNLLEVH